MVAHPLHHFGAGGIAVGHSLSEQWGVPALLGGGRFFFSGFAVSPFAHFPLSLFEAV